MQKIDAIPPEEEFFVLTRRLPGPAQKQLALGVVLVSLVVLFIIIGPLAGMQSRPVEAFVPANLTAMFVNNSITAVLLFAQFSILRTRALLVIANGYVFTALIMIPYVLTFPNVIEPGIGLIGGLQSAAWLYVLWHCGFPMFVFGFALLKDKDLSKPFWQGAVRAPIVLSVALTGTVVSTAAFVCITGEASLPRIMLDPVHFSSLLAYIVGASIASLSVSALVLLWIRRRTVLGLWSMVVTCLYLIEVPLTYYPAPIRFGVGWYAAQVIGLMSSSLVLLLLLYEIPTLYARLLRAVSAQRREREARLMTGDAVAATISHEIKQPLSAMIKRADTGFRWLDSSTPDLDKAKVALKQISADGHRAGAVIDSIRANFKKEDRTRTAVDINDLIEETLSLIRDDLQRHRILLRAEPNTQPPQIIGDRIQLQQVLLNLIGNAIDSMVTKDGPRVLCVKSHVLDDGSVAVSVEDTGIGISSQDAERVFNPLFTTKSGGMGMGLSICRSIIEAHDGHLSVEPNTPVGAVFQFALPPSQ
jgi:signal transduction histidine kinase